MTIKTINNVNASTTIYSPAKVAEIIEVKEAFVKRLLREGHLKGIKMGKFWRVPSESLNEYFANCNQNGSGKKGMNADTKNKIKYHSNLKSQDVLPGTVDKLNEVVAEVKEQVNHLTGFKKVALMARLQHAVTLREELKTKLSSMDKTLDAIGSKAYPELMILKDMDADALEDLFARDANNKGKRMVDCLDKEALESLKADNDKEPQAMAVGQ